jgi:hypothetical protein
VENLEAPCSCSGSVQFTHRACLQRWIDEKGDNPPRCELCKAEYHGVPPYRNPPPRPPPSRPHGEPHVIVWGRNYVLSEDPDTGMVIARRVPNPHGDDDVDEEEDEIRGPLHTATACACTMALIVLCLALIRHLFSLMNVNGSQGDTIR